jgi:hypothetical protein
MMENNLNDTDDVMAAAYTRRQREHLDALIVTAERALSQASLESLALYSSDSPMTVTLHSLYTMCGAVRQWNKKAPGES